MSEVIPIHEITCINKDVVIIKNPQKYKSQCISHTKMKFGTFCLLQKNKTCLIFLFGRCNYFQFFLNAVIKILNIKTIESQKIE